MSIRDLLQPESFQQIINFVKKVRAGPISDVKEVCIALFCLDEYG